jgi:hypothetical protein
LITVDIYINDKLINTISAVNVSEELGKPYALGKQFYQLDTYDKSHPNDNKIIEHLFEDGAVELAIKMLKEIK